MGEQWQVHAGKVDWAVYKQGKISKEYVLTYSSPLTSITKGQ